MKTVLVDLDGTITDSAAGIINAYRHTLAALGIEPPAPEALRWVIGPPARRCFPKLAGAQHDLEHMVRLYRQHYGENGLFEASVYLGIPEALAELRRTSDRLFVCTAKPVPFANRVLAHFGVASFFDGVYGAEFEGRFDDKGELIRHIIVSEGADPDLMVMIGDRDNDILAASRNKVRSIGAAWGYGGTDELVEAGATLTCDTPAELPSAVRMLIG